MPWEKDGKEFSAPLVVGNIAWWHPTPEMLEEAGWRWEEPLPPPEAVDTTAFDAACMQFRKVCAVLGQAIGDPEFKGGFDEYADFITSDFAKTDPAQAALFASMWSGANELCKYEGAKIGYCQPEWWYKCWETVDER